MSAQPLNSDLILISPESAVATPVCGWRAGPYEVDLERRELRCEGRAAALQERPLRLLALLLERGGRPLSRRELQQRLWPGYDWPSFERNLNTAMRKLRAALGDDARAPRLIGTLRSSGYRWIGPPAQAWRAPAGNTDTWAEVGRGEAAGEPGAAAEAARPRPAARRWRAYRAAGAAIAIVLLAFVGWRGTSAPTPTPASGLNLRLTAVPWRAALQERLAALGWAQAVTVDRTPAASVSVARAGGEPETLVLAPQEPLPELLAELAARLPPAHPVVPALTSELNQRYLDATASLVQLRAGQVDAARAAADALAAVRAGAPGHVGAWLAGAQAELALAAFGDAGAAHRARAHAYLQRAVALDPQSPRTAAALASYYNWDAWDGAASARWFALARRLAPQDARVLHGLAWLDLAEGRDAAALAHIAEAAARDPLDPELQANWGWLLYRTGDYAAAALQCRRVGGAAASSAALCEAVALAAQGRHAEAWRRLRSAPPDWLAPHLAELERQPDAAAWPAAQRLAAQWWRGPGRSHYSAAVAEASAGEDAAALQELAAALAAHEPMLRLARATPEFARLRSDAAFARLLAAVGASPAAPGEALARIAAD